MKVSPSWQHPSATCRWLFLSDAPIDGDDNHILDSKDEHKNIFRPLSIIAVGPQQPIWIRKSGDWD